jgi:hypothetical protein
VVPLSSERSAADASAPWPRRGPCRLAPRPTCDVTNTRSPHTIGDETPTPLSRVLHAIFVLLLHEAGSWVSLDAPVPAGPRHCGQLSADIETLVRMIANVSGSKVTLVATIMNHL